MLEKYWFKGLAVFLLVTSVFMTYHGIAGAGAYFLAFLVMLIVDAC